MVIKKKAPKQPAKKKVGRPSMEFNQKTADRICELIADGKSLRTICKYKLMPSRPTVLKWLREVNAFAIEYARAHEDQAEFYAEELLSLSKQANSENANAIRVRADIIKWVCAKLKPRKYADRVGLEVKADIGVTLESSDPLEVARRIMNVLALGEKRLLKMNFPELAKMLKIETQLRRLGIDLEAPFGQPQPEEDPSEPVEVKLLPAPEANKQDAPSMAEAAHHYEQIVSGGEVAQTPQTPQARDEYLAAKTEEAECRRLREENFVAALVSQRPSRFNR